MQKSKGMEIFSRGKLWQRTKRTKCRKNQLEIFKNLLEKLDLSKLIDFMQKLRLIKNYLNNFQIHTRDDCIVKWIVNTQKIVMAFWTPLPNISHGKSLDMIISWLQPFTRADLLSWVLLNGKFSCHNSYVTVYKSGSNDKACLVECKVSQRPILSWL